MNPEEVRYPEAGEALPEPPRAYPANTIGGMMAAQEKLKHSGVDRSYIQDSPENSVVLSHRLRFLCAQVGGCQTEQVEAVIRRVLYEVLSGKR